MKKIISIVVGLLALAAAGVNAYLLFFKSDKSAETTATSSSTVASSNSETAASSSEKVTVGQYADGTYTGELVSTNRGDFQVQVTIEDGKMTDISMLEWPQDNPQSKEISGNALPIYTAEALENQSAEVSQISGASEAFKGFTGSLQDALNQAS